MPRLTRASGSLALLVAGFAAIGAALAAPDPEIVNGGFENTQGGPTTREILVGTAWTSGPVEGPQPAGWMTRVFAGDVRPSLDTPTRHSGRVAATLKSVGPREVGSASLYQAVPQNLQQGQDVTVRFWLKKTPLARAGISVWSDSGGHFESQAYWDFQADFTQWREIQFCFQASRTTTQGFWVMLSLDGDAGEQAWFDDVSCQLGRPTQLEGPPFRVAAGVPADVQARGLGCFATDPCEEIGADRPPLRLSAQGRLTLDVCPGEIASGAVGVYALRALANVRVTPGSLVAARGSLPADAVDVRVVKWWRQRRSVWTSQPPPTVVLPDYLIPELLLKDDRWTDANRPRGFSPDLRLTGPCVTDFAADSGKQFWLTVRVPAKTAPGSYRGQVTIAPEGAPAATVALTVNVLPFRLADPPEILGAYLNTGMRYGRDPATFSDARYESELRDMRDHGFNAAGILDGVSREQVDGQWVLRWDTLRRALECRQRLGLDRFNMFEGFIWATPETIPVYRGGLNADTTALLQWFVRALNQAVREAGLRPLSYYLVDEPESQPNGLADCARLGQLIHEAGGETCTALAQRSYEALGPALDVPILGLGLATRRALEAVRTGRAPRPAHPVLCYWQFWEEHPLLNRYHFGLFLWASGLQGAMPYGYQHYGGQGDPYDDFDTGDKDMFAAYPSRDGSVPTVQWEACREGINDLRVLHRLEAAVAAADARVRTAPFASEASSLRTRMAAAQGFLRSLRQRVQVVPAAPVQALPQAAEYARLRGQMIAHIEALEGLGAH